MSLRIEILPYRLHFKQPAGTSRGVYTAHDVWYVVATDTCTGVQGVGECAPLLDLSCDYSADYAVVLRRLCDEVCRTSAIDYELFRPYPSMLFGLETAFRQLERQSWLLWSSPLTSGEQGIPINGLVWMGSFDEMLRRTDEKLQLGFHCVKIKIGAIDFEKEIALIEHLRSKYDASRIQLRLDANGAFALSDALRKLERLSAFDVHSIEQPIRAGQWTEMARLCRQSPIPIALDEELIGVAQPNEKQRLLDTIRPQYIVLKPSLHGGISGAEEWISLARERNTGYWITSALESNIGLNAIAQWTATLKPQMPQGLGTGALYVNNIDLPLRITGDKLFVDARNYPSVEQVIETVKTIS
ncbi:MAG: o-succinylbenzoate synthase [Bacteroidales bacterium]|nr:o-succinylbenzoate synthase [Bacteroidales bacterium]